MKAVLLAVFVFLFAVGTAWGADMKGGDGMLSVKDFGALGDGKTDDTDAFQKALDAAGKVGGGIVFAPTGEYLIKSHLSVPDEVTLEGIWRTPSRAVMHKGTLLLAVEGAGKEDGTPFITLHTDSTLHGIAVYYPDQNKDLPAPYPWCVRGIGDNCTLKDVTLINPWQAVDFGTYPAGRHMIKGLYTQAIRRGVFVDKCFDVGRIEDVHIWPFWDYNSKVKDYMLENGEAFIFGRTDWEYVSNCFCIGYKVGYRFSAFKDGPGNVVLTQSGSDVGPCAVLVEAVQDHAGVSFSNSQFMAGVVVKPGNNGPVKFASCGFWGYGKTDSHAILEGTGQTMFTACHFTWGGQVDAGAPTIVARNGGLTVSGCDFMDADRKQIRLEKAVQSAVIMGNRLRGGARIENESTGDVQIGLNTTK